MCTCYVRTYIGLSIFQVLFRVYSSFYVNIFCICTGSQQRRRPNVILVLVYLPFGYGPRNCVGMMFALMEAKMALIEIVRNFKIELSPETKVLIMCVCTLTVVLWPKFGHITTLNNKGYRAYKEMRSVS